MKTKAQIAVAIVCFGGFGSFLAAAQQSSEAPASASSYGAMLNQYCVLCHNETLKTGGLMLDLVDVDNASQNPEIWEKVVRKLRTESMPPAGMPRPDTAGYESLAVYLENQLDTAAAANPHPGRPSAVHRLNRVEYTNAVRDLLALELDGDALLPADEAGAGFDNNGDILSVSALLMERYLIAARHISRVAVADSTLLPVSTTFSAPKTGLQLQRESEYLPFGSRGGMDVKYNFPLDGEYSIRIRLLRTNGIEGPRIIGLGEPHQLDVRVDGARVKLLSIGGENDLRPDEVEESLEFSFPARAGTQQVGVTFLNEELAPEGMLRPLQIGLQFKGWGPRDDSRRPPGIESISISGPFNAQRTTTTPSRSKIFVCQPNRASEEEKCAREILSGLARYAYRRPVTGSEIDDLMSYYKSGRDTQTSGSAFEEGIRMALEMILVSPDFLFRVERTPADVTEDAFRLSDLELASRLSFFLWSSIPDKELLDLAIAGKLKNPPVLEQQVRRLLADSRSTKSLVDNFFGQWFGLRGVEDYTPDAILFPEFDDDLRKAFEEESNLLFASMLREDHSVLELLNTNYTYVNERLARHYGIPDVYGGRFRRVTLADENRWGVLGKGAIQMITSLPNRTSPVLRGKWVLENVMGAPPPPPPPNVPAFPENKETDVTQLSVRDRLAAHRANPFCATCHSRMDPLGFALDHFDPVGEWRNAEVNPITSLPEFPVVINPIETAGVLPDGTEFQDLPELRKLLMRKPENIAYVVADRLLTYALGRELTYNDAPALRQIVTDAAADDFRWSSIIWGIVTSTPFQMRAPAQPEPELTAAERH